MTGFRNTRFILFILFFLQGCGLFESMSDVIVGQYKVSFGDGVSWRSLSLGNRELIGPYVYAVGHNEKFIVAKQHPNHELRFEVNTHITKYFIIDITKDNRQGRGIYGPLERNQFDSLSAALNIGAIAFDMNYPEQPNVFAR